MNDFMARIFGANWSTTVPGGVFVLSLFFVEKPDLLSAVVSPSIAHTIGAWAALLSGGITFWQTKSKFVTGGTVQQTAAGNLAPEGKQSLVDETIKASPHDELTPRQKQVVKTL